jgi:DNA-binding response OmpR family regulator
MNAPLSILFADRDLAATRPHRMQLRLQGARVDFSDSPAEVLRRSEHDRPDLLVLDDRLPAGADEDFIARVQANAPDTGIILLHDGSGAMPFGMGLGLLFSARKPLSSASLLEVIEGEFPGRLGPAVPLPELPPILCVDDDDAYRASLSRLLRRRGYPVVAAGNALEALAWLPRLRFAAVLVDIMMSGMDGIGLTHEIRDKSGDRVAVVVLTGLASEETTYTSLENGARFCLTKPCEPEELLNVVDFLAGGVDAEERKLLEQKFSASSTPKSAV